MVNGGKKPSLMAVTMIEVMYLDRSITEQLQSSHARERQTYSPSVVFG